MFLTDVSSQHVLDLLLLEFALDDETACAVDGSGGAHFSEEELDDVFGLSMHAFADVGHVGEDGLFVALAMDRGRCDGVALPGGVEERGVGGVEGGVETGQ